MECVQCGSNRTVRWGTRKNKQQWRCKSCEHYFTFGEKKPKENRPIVFNYSLGYVVGVLLGDGSLSRWKDYYYFDDSFQHVPKVKATKIVPRYRYGFQLTCVDKEFAVMFAKHLKATTGKKPCLYPISLKPVREIASNILSKPYVFHGFKVMLRSKEWYDKIKPLTVQLRWIKESDDQLKCGFLRGFFDSEGGWGSWGAVNLTNKNPEFLNLSKDLLAELCISSVIYSKRKMPLLRILKKEAPKFLKIIGFSIERKNKKIWELLNA